MGVTSDGRDCDDGYRPGTAAYHRVVAALFAAGVATFALIYSTQALLPALARDFGVSATASTLSLSLTTLALSVALLLAGPMSDVAGRTRLIHLSLGASSLVAVGCALAPTWHLLLGLRLLEGLTLAGLPAVATAYLREELHPTAHARAAGLYIGGTALGGMSGRLLTGAVAELAGWRWALAAAAGVGMLCALAVRLLLPPSRGFDAAERHPRALARATRRALADRGLLALYGIGGCSMGALVSVYNTLGFRLEQPPFDLGLAAASLVFVCYALGSVSSVVAGRLADALGRRAVVPAAALLAVTGVALTLSDSLTVVVAGVAVLTTGFFAVHGVASGWVPVRAHTGGAPAGQAASLYLFTYYLGSSVLGSVAGAVWTTRGWPGVVVLAVVLMLATAGLGLVLRRTPSLLARADRG